LTEALNRLAWLVPPGFHQSRGDKEIMEIHPLADRVLVDPKTEKEKRKGGIVIPDTAKERPQEGKVIAVGAGRLGENGKRIPPDLKQGDRVLFKEYSGTEVEIDDRKYLIMTESDILATI
jgi:chaperonin GroES